MSIANDRPLGPARIKSLVAALKAPSRKSFLVEGWLSTVEVARSEWEIETLIVTGVQELPAERKKLLEEIRRSAREVVTATKRQLDRIADTEHHQGIAAVVRWRPASPSSMVSSRCRLLCLDGVADPGNAGTLVRTADWFGFDGVLAGAGGALLTNAKVVRSTMGSLFHIPVADRVDLPKELGTLKQKGVRIVVADGNATHTFRGVALDVPVALILGNETRGIDPSIMALADIAVCIPRIGSAESLNVSIAGAILMSHMTSGIS